jgi:membrane protease YdiL (CAAX protease family)
VGSQDLSGAGVVGALLFTLLVLLAPVAEEMFFRDILQRERGLVVSIVVYAVAGVILFLPTAGDFFVVLVAVSGAMALLGVLYAFLFERYGLTVTLACHITLNLCLLYVPVLASCLDLM